MIICIWEIPHKFLAIVLSLESKLILMIISFATGLLCVIANQVNSKILNVVVLCVIVKQVRFNLLNGVVLNDLIVIVKPVSFNQLSAIVWISLKSQKNYQNLTNK